jgi:hypothetical protein
MFAGQAIDRRTIRCAIGGRPARPGDEFAAFSRPQLVEQRKSGETLEGGAGLGGKAPERADLFVSIIAAVKPCILISP